MSAPDLRLGHPPENARADLRLSALALRSAEDNQPRPVRPCKDGGPAYRCRNGGKQEVYFRRDDMGRLCTFSRAQCDAVRSEREAA